MDPEDVHEDHRKYLEIKDNPKRVSSAAIFQLLSEGLVELRERQAIIETKQDQSQDTICKIDKMVEKVTGELDDEQRKLRADFEAEITANARRNGKFEERFSWQEKMQKAIIVLVLFIISFLFLIFGIPLPFP